MSYINKIIALTIMGSFYSAYSCTGCNDKLKNNYQETKAPEDQKCSCSQKPTPKPPRPTTKLDETAECSCSHPKPPKPTNKSGENTDQNTTKIEATADCSCSHPKPPRPATKLDETAQCSCSSHPKPPKPKTKEGSCIYVENETITAELVEKIVKLRIKIEGIQDKNFAERAKKELDIVSDVLKILTESDIDPDEINNKLLSIKKLLNEIENTLNVL